MKSRKGPITISEWEKSIARMRAYVAHFKEQGETEEAEKFQEAVNAGESIISRMRKNSERGRSNRRPTPRDPDGWLVPSVSSISRQVYDLAKAGKSVDEISQEIGMRKDVVSVRLKWMKDPETYNAAQRARKAARSNANV